MTVADAPATVGARRPDQLLAGAAHAGTGRLVDQLRRHPDLLLAATEQPHYFSGIRPSRRFERTIPVVADQHAYLALFAEARPGQRTGEASSSYLWSPEAPGRIAAVAPDARIAILLRDPIERAWAHHRHDAAQGAERRGFLRAIRDELQHPGRWGHEPVYLGAGFYADALERYQAVFGPGRLWIRFFESVDPDPRTAASELVAWLGLDPSSLPVAPPRPAPRPDPSVARAHGLLGSLRRWRAAVAPGQDDAGPVMDDTIRRLLEEVYAPDVQRVSDLLGVIPPWSITPAL